MEKLHYTPCGSRENTKKINIYHSDSIYADENLREKFLIVKANVCDLNPALITKAVTGTEQDFVMFMDSAATFIKDRFPGIETSEVAALLSMVRDCIFGYYVLSPLINDRDISDIRVIRHDHITVKVKGRRYVSDCRFTDKADYDEWLLRILRINRMKKDLPYALCHYTDTKWSRDDYLRTDIEQSYVTSSGKNHIHIRKFPTKKDTLPDLEEKGMLTGDMAAYIKDRIDAGYGFLISGKGGSGKSTLLNSMIDEIPYDESVLVVQESDELYSDEHPQAIFEHTIKGLGKEELFSLEDELRMGLLQDIDNFVIGEIKGGEALYVFTTALSTGARFFGTIHANNAKGSVRRLSHCARYISDYSVETLEAMLSDIPVVLIHLREFAIDEILETGGSIEDSGSLVYHTVYKKEQKNGTKDK